MNALNNIGMYMIHISLRHLFSSPISLVVFCFFSFCLSFLHSFKYLYIFIFPCFFSPSPVPSFWLFKALPAGPCSAGLFLSSLSLNMRIFLPLFSLLGCFPVFLQSPISLPVLQSWSTPTTVADPSAERVPHLIHQMKWASLLSSCSRPSMGL